MIIADGHGLFWLGRFEEGPAGSVRSTYSCTISTMDALCSPPRPLSARDRLAPRPIFFFFPGSMGRGGVGRPATPEEVTTSGGERIACPASLACRPLLFPCRIRRVPVTQCARPASTGRAGHRRGGREWEARRASHGTKKNKSTCHTDGSPLEREAGTLEGEGGHGGDETRSPR